MCEDFLLETKNFLSRILSAFISEYRAIFEIESTLEHNSFHHENLENEAHEHRKRHEEGDECPEDIKAM